METEKRRVNYHHLPFLVKIDRDNKTIYAKFASQYAKSMSDVNWFDMSVIPKESKSVCDPNDEWDEYFGIQLSLGRAYIEYLKALRYRAYIEYLKALRHVVKETHHLRIFPSFFIENVTNYPNQSLGYLNNFRASVISRLTFGIEHHKTKVAKLYAKKYGKESIPRSLLPKDDKRVLIKGTVLTSGKPNKNNDSIEEDLEKYGPLGND